YHLVLPRNRGGEAHAALYDDRHWLRGRLGGVGQHRAQRVLRRRPLLFKWSRRIPGSRGDEFDVDRWGTVAARGPDCACRNFRHLLWLRDSARERQPGNAFPLSGGWGI